MKLRSAAWGHVVFFALLIVLLMAHFALLRGGMMIRNRGNADGATATQVARAFVTGARFDLATACFILAPFAVLAHLPRVGFDRSPRHRAIFFWIFTALMSVLTFTCLAEFEFFHEFQSRFNQVALQYLNQPATVGGMVWYNYPVLRYVLLWLALSVPFALCVRWLMNRVYRDAAFAPPNLLADIGVGALLVALFVLGMRGGVQSEPLRWGNAFTSQSEFANQMGLNGVYTLATTVRNGLSGKNLSSNWTRRMPMADARQVTRALLVESDETLIDPADRTVFRSDTGHDQWVTLNPTPRPPNVVLVLMESFSARFVGAVGAPGGFTPSIDALAKDGILFRRAFSSGTHTHQGVFSTVLSFPNLPGYEYLMENYAGNQSFSALPAILKQQGYQTLFLYNGNLAWDNMRGFLRKQGIEKFVGGADFGPEIKKDRVWGVSDKDLLDRANTEFDRASKSDKPFFGLILTLSNHAPFDVPEPLPFQRTTGMGELNKRLDALRYADWAIGQFIERARTLPYFDDTLFVFVGDHGFHVPPKLTDVNLTYHHVPLVFYAPKLLQQKGVVKDTAVNQVNIAPSILGLLGGHAPAAHWARNVFETDFADSNFAVFKGSGGTPSVAIARDDRLLVVGDDGKPRLYRYDLGFPPSVKPLNGPGQAPTARRMQRELEGYVQSALADLLTHQAGPEHTATADIELLSDIAKP